ncbi:MAG TPA: PVC-type heme-binding CxxCH protein, partial [Schlesneria sp.]
MYDTIATRQRSPSTWTTKSTSPLDSVLVPPMRIIAATASVIVVLFLRLLLTGAADSPKPNSFPDPINTEQDTSTKALSPDDAARGFRVPDGFKVTVFAAEPDVQNPIAMAWDHRGRLWVAENYTYGDRMKKFDLSLRDRVLILEDTNGDGRFDKRTVFTDDVQMLTGIALGNDGVWLMTPPQLIYIPDRDGNDKPDGAPVVMLDGFTPATDNHHTFANGLKWGPDGWLYGRCGASSPGRLGTPGTPDEKRVPLFGGLWRFRPAAIGAIPDFSLSGGRQPPGPIRADTQSSSPEANPSARGLTPPAQKGTEAIVEVLCHGTTNPWGHDWNEHGEAFFINTVNGHLWHAIPGAHFRRPHSEDPNPYAYATIDTHADHYHWDTGKDWTDSRNVKGEHDRLGGGHAHSGMTIYLGDNWPDAYHGRLLTLNLHGRRVNVERLEPRGAGYVGRHEPDMLFAADPWFRGIDLSYGPDGAVYVLDWSDTGECHEQTGVHRKSGRIYKVSNGEPKHSRVDLNALSITELLALHRRRNEWFVRQARRRLMDLASHRDWNAATQQTVRDELLTMFKNEATAPLKLRALHTLYVLGLIDQPFLLANMWHPDPNVRVWAIRLLTDAWPLDTIMGDRHPEASSTISETVFAELVRAANEDESPLTRLVLASTLQRLPVDHRLKLAAPLASRISDAADHNLPLMIWYGLLPIAKSQPVELAQFVASCQFPTTRRLISRRLAEMIDEQPRAVETLLTAASAHAVLPDVLKGLSEGLAGRHKVKAPANWSTLQTEVASLDDIKLHDQIRDLSVLFGDGRALDEVQCVALDNKAELAARRAALQTLIDNRAPDRRKVCEQLLGVRYLNTTAIRGLTEFDDASIGLKLANSYRNFFPVDRPAVIDALVTRPSFAEALLDQIAAGKIAKTDLTVLHARQILSFGNPKLTARLIEVWGELRESSADRQQLITKWKSQLTPAIVAQADKPKGREVFNKACANCHRLYGHGGQIGPDLTGSGRQNLDYVLINLIDPSAAVGADYRMAVVVLEDGRVLNGIVASKT